MYATVSACTILLALKFAGGCSEVWRALVSLIHCMFKISQYGALLQVNVLSVVCYCVTHYNSYIPWHTQMRISFLCDVTLTHPCTVHTRHERCVYVLSISFLCDFTLTHPCTVYTGHKRCVHMLSISFLCDVALTHPLCAHDRWWIIHCCAQQKLLLNSYP